MKIQTPVYYGDYLQLPKILNAQAPESTKYGKTAHDETLFIIIHQAYELWFKQILHELNSVREIMQQPFVPSTDLSVIIARIERVTTIQQLLIDQIQVMETMTSLDFMEFRDFLVPASGFQSIQFKLIEAILGIKAQHRMEVEKQFFNSRLKAEDKKLLEAEEARISIFELLEAWLERMPFSQFEDFDFWGEYSHAVDKMLKQDREIISNNPVLDDRTRTMELKNLDMTQNTFNTLLDSRLYSAWQGEGKVRLSQKAMLSAVFIYLYRDYPALQMPFRILNALVEVDEKFTTWRYRHAIMVQRILGTKIGTGGSSGHEYLRSTTERNRAFIDFFNLATFLIPKSMIPALPQNIKDQLDIVYDSFRP
ncbi:tryptophan 2,3-dioxygenase family protein [Peredibacter starrii]|uniref:Tryptophan 2,3-dioxygenase n=1 Tax=Peredibacter starrii TaxID=28202 RepID=A0AAX4HT94_9BACT|nr:tryptophan 2,3-dioxygenase family protein [Peredibacter starrii]WPU66398.1 tryptophan 2,3-dioxygenase family protein [Peredibacter starrii]